MIPQTALVIPLFLLLGKVGLLDTPWAVILPSLVFPIGVFLMRAYIDERRPQRDHRRRPDGRRRRDLHLRVPGRSA